MTPNPTSIKRDESTFRILSLSGGGLNGAIGAGILKTVETELGVKIADHFDLIAGTSTGGILALGLGLGIPGTALAEFYRTKGKSIFPQDGPGFWRGFKNLFCAKYSADALNRELREMLGDRLVGDSVVPLVIPSFDLAQNDVRLFKTRHHADYRRDNKLPAWAVARATSAAPTYLPACREIDNAQLIDGGVFANNPIMIGVTEAIATFAVSPQSIRILSLGASLPVKRHCKWLDNAGLAQWGLRASDMLITAQSASSLAQARRLVGRNNVMHIDPPVAEGEFALDLAQPDRHESIAAHYAQHALPELERMFFQERARIGASALLNPIGGLHYAA